jgi:hypothetical protein
MKNIIYTSDNLNSSSSYNNVFTSSFPSGSVVFSNESVSLAEISIYNSFLNITSATTYSRYNNNEFQYIWVDGTTVTVTLPDGAYEYSDINTYLISVMTDNGHYLINSSSENVYYLNISVSTTQYGVILTCYAVPSTLPSGWSLPSGATWSLPVSASTPQFVILSSNNFYKVVGYTAGTYPSVVQSTDYNTISDLVPQITPVSAIFLNCDIANNKISIPTSYIYAFTTGDSKFGSVISIRPPAFLWIPVFDGSYKNVSISFTSQDNQPLYITDTNLCVILAVESNNMLRY